MSEQELTKTQERTKEKESERDRQRRKARERQQSVIDRDARLRQVADTYMPQIKSLKEKMHREQKAIYDAWKEQRSKAE